MAIDVNISGVNIAKVRTFGASSIDDAITAIAHKITLERHIVLQFLLILIYD